MTGRRTTTLKHGVTLDDLRDAARIATASSGGNPCDWVERYDTAHAAIAEHLYAADHRPPAWRLVAAGQEAIRAERREWLHHHGYYKRNLNGFGAGPGSSPAYVKYWAGARTMRQDVEDGVVERIALRQIMRQLPYRHREMLADLAALGDVASVADAQHMSHGNVRSVLSRARRDFLRLWHEGETPSGLWRWSKSPVVWSTTTGIDGAA